MRDTIHGKPGIATGRPPDEDALSPLRKRGKGKSPAEKSRKNDAARSKPDLVSASPSRPAPPSPAAAEAKKRGSEPLADHPELSKQIAEIAGKSQQLVAEFLTRQGREEGVGMAELARDRNRFPGDDGPDDG